MNTYSKLKGFVRAALELPLRRPDGQFVVALHPYRKMLSYMMPGRNEAIVYYDDAIRADALLDFISRTCEKFPVDVTHCLVAAANIGLHQNPKMNQFVVGKRLYARNHVAITFSVKRKKLNKEAKLAAVKLRIEKNESFEELCERINAHINIERSTAKTLTDQELGLLTRLPRPLLSGCLNLTSWLDNHNLLPKKFIDNDAFYTSMFIANLGSLGMRAAYHHLYDYGTAPLFMMAGQIEERPVVQDGQVVVQKILPIRWSYDERIDDGYTSKFGMKAVRDVLENPEQYLGSGYRHPLGETHQGSQAIAS